MTLVHILKFYLTHIFLICNYGQTIEDALNNKPLITTIQHSINYNNYNYLQPSTTYYFKQTSTLHSYFTILPAREQSNYMQCDNRKQSTQWVFKSPTMYKSLEHETCIINNQSNIYQT